jgi:acetyl esterase/lipase
MKPWFVAALATAWIMSVFSTAKAEYDVVIRPDVEYVQHDGVKLTGELYLPKGLDKAPIVIAVHGGGWQNGSHVTYKYWGPFLAKNGYAVFAINFRQGKDGAYPRPVYDVKAAVQFVRAKSADLGIDPGRIGLIGDSSGSHLVSLVALAGDQFTSEYRNDPNVATSAGVKAVIVFYGIYDMLAQWNHDQITRPRDQITEKFLGASPVQNRRIFFESSPISYAIVGNNQPRFLLIHGTTDDIADPASQSEAFRTALNQAGFFVRRFVIPGAGHFWANEPIEDEPGSYVAATAPRLLRFLAAGL